MKNWSIFILAVCLTIGSQALAEKAKYQNDTIYFDKVTAKPGEHFAVGVYLFNVDSVAGMQVPTFYRSEKIKLYCDSISFVGSRCDYFMFQDTKIPDDDQVAYFNSTLSIPRSSEIPCLRAMAWSQLYILPRRRTVRRAPCR